MAGRSLWRWYIAVCTVSILGLLIGFYIDCVGKTNTTQGQRAKLQTPGKVSLTGRTTQRAPAARYTVKTTLSPVVRAKRTRQVTLHCKTVCSESAGGICVPLDLAVFVYKNGTPTANMTFNLQSHNPVVHIARSNTTHQTSVLEVERCNLEEHFPGVELIPRQTSCAVVGNSGILNNSSCGHFIDSHDFVIRANMALIRGYETDVGKRSSLNCFNRGLLTMYGNTFKQSERNAKKPNLQLRFLDHIRTLQDSILWYPKHLVRSGSEHVHRASQQYRSIIDTIKQNGLLGIRFTFSWQPIRVEQEWGLPLGSATLGLDMYAVARTFCSNITLIGFYPFHEDPEGRPIKYHYFDNGKFNFSRKSGHFFALEYTKLQELEGLGKLTLVVRDCK